MGFCPFRATITLSPYPGRCPGLFACWPFRPYLCCPGLCACWPFRPYLCCPWLCACWPFRPYLCCPGLFACWPFRPYLCCPWLFACWPFRPYLCCPWLCACWPFRPFLRWSLITCRSRVRYYKSFSLDDEGGAGSEGDVVFVDLLEGEGLHRRQLRRA